MRTCVAFICQEPSGFFVIVSRGSNLLSLSGFSMFRYHSSPPLLVGYIFLIPKTSVSEELKTSSSVIDAQLFTVLPLTVTLTYLASVAVMTYFSEFSVVPLLSPLNTWVNVVPSVDVDIVKWYTRAFPLYHAMSTLQMF